MITINNAFTRDIAYIINIDIITWYTYIPYIIFNVYYNMSHAQLRTCTCIYRQYKNIHASSHLE